MGEDEEDAGGGHHHHHVWRRRPLSSYLTLGDRDRVQAAVREKVRRACQSILTFSELECMNALLGRPI